MSKKIIIILSIFSVLFTQSVIAQSAKQLAMASAIVRPEGTTPFTGDRAELVAKGEALWNDKSLSESGKTNCVRCHKDNTKGFKKTFLDAYPHYVKMSDSRAKLESITTEGMVQFCMLVPMKNDAALPWDSEDLAALAAYVEDVVQVVYVEEKGPK